MPLKEHIPIDTAEERDLLYKEKELPQVGPRPPDGGWGWMVVAACFLQYVIEAGLLSSYGVLYVKIMDDMGINKVEVSWIDSIRTGIYLGAAPIVAPFTKFVSCRVLTILGGVIAFVSFIISVFVTSLLALLVCLGFFQGIAFALVFVSSNLVVNHYFDKKRPIAIGLAVCGAGVGISVYPVLQDFLLEEYGISGGMLVNAALTLHVVLSGTIYFPLKTNRGRTKGFYVTNETKSVRIIIKDMFDFHLFKMPKFVIFLVHNILIYIGGFVPFAFLPDRAKIRGFSLKDASILVSVIGISSSFGRVTIGLLSSKLSTFRPQLYVILTLAAGIVVLILPFCTNYTEFTLFSIGFGIFSGGYICLCNVLLLDLFKRDLLASSLGFVTLAQGIGGFIGSPMAAGISEAFGSDDVMFYFSGVMYVVAGLVLQVSLWCQGNDSEKSETIVVHLDSEK